MKEIIKYLDVINYTYPCLKPRKRLKEFITNLRSAPFFDWKGVRMVGVENNGVYEVWKIGEKYYYVERCKNG